MYSENKVGIGYFDKNENVKYSIEICRKLIIESLISGGLGNIDIRNPLLDIIKPGSVVLLKPNWVNHANYNNVNTEPLITHMNFIEAVVMEVSQCEPKKIIIADAPIQGCDISKIFNQEWLINLTNSAKCSIEVKDLRRTTYNKHSGRIKKIENVRDLKKYILFDLEEKSLLEPVSNQKEPFRVVMYDAELLNHRHKKGKHQYLIAKEVFEADIILNLSKLKTHRKAGLTGALKNIIGVNGNKEFLPHHRVGGKIAGGDCYPDKSILKRISEYFIDQSNKQVGSIMSIIFYKCACIFLGISKRFGNIGEIEGGWYGNDTIWRTILDINSILLYGKLDGTMSHCKQRQIFSITDAIIAGDTEGPLSVEPVLLKIVSFASSSVFADMVHAALMKFDWTKIPSIKNAFGVMEFPLTSFNAEDCEVVINGNKIDMKELSEKYAKIFRAPINWRGFIEVDSDSILN